MAPTTDPIIEIKQVGRSFGSNRALTGIDFHVRKGEIFGLVGADGAGKTTLLQILAAILDPSEGECRVLGFDTRRESASVTSRIGYMAQGFSLYEHLTVAENIAFSATIRGVTGQTYVERRGRLLQMAGLSPFLDRREGQLSGGMRKKLALCTNLIHMPELLILDEPTLGVDPLSRNELWHILTDFREEGATIVFSTSYMEEAEVCDRVAFLDTGRITALGPPEELRARANDAVFFLSSDKPTDAYAILSGHHSVIGVQWRTDGIKFQIIPGLSLAADLKQNLGLLGTLESVEPTIEDAFITTKEAGQGTAEIPEPRLPSLPLTEPDDEASSPLAVQTRKLTRRFGDFVAVDNVTLDVNRREILGLLGPNGAGKTTLIRLLCGLLQPSEGAARVAGVNVAENPGAVRSRIGYMSQKFSLYPDLTVGENMWFFARAYGLSRRQGQEAIGWATAMTGLEGFEDKGVESLSGALRQRLALACSMLHRPSVLFLDEPTSGVDPFSRYRFWRLINELAIQGVTIIVTTHYLAEAAYCHRLGLMHEGRLIALGDLTSLRAGLGETIEDDVEAIFIAYIERERSRTSRSQPMEMSA